jgi:hypothetical protein
LDTVLNVIPKDVKDEELVDAVIKNVMSPPEAEEEVASTEEEAAPAEEEEKTEEPVEVAEVVQVEECSPAMIETQLSTPEEPMVPEESHSAPVDAPEGGTTNTVDSVPSMVEKMIGEEDATASTDTTSKGTAENMEEQPIFLGEEEKIDRVMAARESL